MTPYQVGVAAEALAAALFSWAGCDVSVQYGANQPGYDLTAIARDRAMRVSVKGSQDGSWGLTMNFITKGAGDYQAAAEKWALKHRGIAFCFVQFAGVDFPVRTPNVYLAWADEVADRLKATAAGRGDTILYERQAWTARARGAGTVDEIPPMWRFSRGRVEEMLGRLA